MQSQGEIISKHITDFTNKLYNPELYTYFSCNRVHDDTIANIPKSYNFRTFRQSFYLHKGRHLLKLVLIVALDGCILDIQGYFSDSQNNDAAILQNEFHKDIDRMQKWFQEKDIMIVDREYRDATELLIRLEIRWKMPALLKPKQSQLPTDETKMIHE